MPAPPLPPSWPFPPRLPLPPAATRAGVALPGLDGAWTLVAAPELDLDQAPEAMDGAFGRGGVFRCGDLVLRPYRRGGLVRHLNARAYPGPGRFEREFQVHRALWDAGLPTVEPLGYAFRPLRLGTEGVYLTRLAPGEPWPRRWDPRALPQVAAILEALCAWGLQAPDLNATNFLVDSEGRTLALDWDRALWAPGVPLMERYRRRLGRSMAKLHAPPAFVI